MKKFLIALATTVALVGLVDVAHAQPAPNHRFLMLWRSGFADLKPSNTDVVIRIGGVSGFNSTVSVIGKQVWNAGSV
jgi:hypothetical protein